MKGLTKLIKGLRREEIKETKRGEPENIESHEAGIKKLEMEARQNQLRKRKMKRG